MKKKKIIIPKKKLKKDFPAEKEIVEQKYVDEFMDAEDNDDLEYPFEEKIKSVPATGNESENKIS